MSGDAEPKDDRPPKPARSSKILNVAPMQQGTPMYEELDQVVNDSMASDTDNKDDRPPKPARSSKVMNVAPKQQGTPMYEDLDQVMNDSMAADTDKDDRPPKPVRRSVSETKNKAPNSSCIPMYEEI